MDERKGRAGIDRFLNPVELVGEELQDQLDRTRHLLTGSPEEAVARALERAGAADAVEARIVADLADLAPLARPDRFLPAHRVTVRALEVLDRDGSRDPRLPNLGPLSPLAERGVELVAEFITQSHAKNVAGELRKLYAAREAQCPIELPERRLLGRARVEVDRLAQAYGGFGGVPLLLAGGAIVPALGAAFQHFGALDFHRAWVLLAAIAVLAAVFFGLSWVLLRGAAVAHRRARLIMQPALVVLWDTIGHCGDPPEDDSTMFATIAIALTALVWFALPVAVGLSFFV